MIIRRVSSGRAYKLTTSFLAFLAFAEFTNAFAKTPETKPAPQRATENFWISTGGPQGGNVLSLVRSPNYIVAGTLGGGAFRSADNGETWTPINNGLTATDIRALATNTAGDLFAGTFGGVFRSTDDGDTWAPVNNGLEYPFIISLAINSSGDIFAGTFEGGGIYRSTDNG